MSGSIRTSREAAQAEVRIGAHQTGEFTVTSTVVR
jgi:hypothetical protein